MLSTTSEQYAPCQNRGVHSIQYAFSHYLGSEPCTKTILRNRSIDHVLRFVSVHHPKTCLLSQKGRIYSIHQQCSELRVVRRYTWTSFAVQTIDRRDVKPLPRVNAFRIVEAALMHIEHQPRGVLSVLILMAIQPLRLTEQSASNLDYAPAIFNLAPHHHFILLRRCSLMYTSWYSRPS